MIIPKSVLDQCLTVAELAILENITGQKQVDGTKLKRNARSTQERKKMLGRQLKSLIDEKHRFVKGQQKSWKHVIKGAMKGGGFDKFSIGIFPANAELVWLNEEVQGKGYTGWFGVNKRALDVIYKILNHYVASTIKKAAKQK